MTSLLPRWNPERSRRRCAFVARRMSARSQLLVSLLLLLTLLSVATAQASASPVGTWALSLDGQILFLLSISPVNAVKSSFTGSLSRPLHFQTRDDVAFSHIEGPVETERIIASQWKGGALSFTVQNSTNGSDKTSYSLTVQDEAHVQLQVEGIPLLRCNCCAHSCRPRSVFSGIPPKPTRRMTTHPPAQR